ncbi:MAG TPA: hypothetical protein VMB50_22435, partial [Myxococcales bacterium]|nr:hypothetical protein [Myxococcales bacterium]
MAASPEAAPTTPMMRQYLDVKAQVPDAILMFRLGDFYEMFFDDAVTASSLLDITLTARSKGDDKVPMCGVPHHAARAYIARLVSAGHKVAVCDQVPEGAGSGGNPAEAGARSNRAGGGGAKLFRREITRIVTPGMVLDDELLDPRASRWLAAVAAQEGRLAVAFLDISTGQLQVADVGAEDAAQAALEELWRHAPSEVLLSAGLSLPGLAALGAVVHPLEGSPDRAALASLRGGPALAGAA